MDEVVGREQQRLTRLPSQGVREAVAEVQRGGVATAPAVVAVRGPAQRDLLGRDRHDVDAQPHHEVVEQPADLGPSEGIGDDARLEQGACRDAYALRRVDGLDEGVALRLVPHDGDERRGADDHTGNPFSSWRWSVVNGRRSSSVSSECILSRVDVYHRSRPS